MPQAHKQLLFGSDEEDFSGVIVYDIRNQDLIVLLQDYYKVQKPPDYRDGWRPKNMQPQIKFPGGKHSEGDKNAYYTAAHELEQETNLCVWDSEFPDDPDQIAMLNNLIHVYTFEKVPGRHNQHFFAVRYDELLDVPERKGDIWENDEEFLIEPRWVMASRAMQILFRTHRPALEHMITVLSSQQDGVYDKDVRYAARRDPNLARFLADR